MPASMSFDIDADATSRARSSISIVWSPSS
jgi:hypothetical protein